MVRNLSRRVCVLNSVFRATFLFLVVASRAECLQQRGKSCIQTLHVCECLKVSTHHRTCAQQSNKAVLATMQVLAKPSAERRDKELAPVLRLLQKVEFTAALESTVLRELARYVMYESYPHAEHTVVKQGDPGALFYIILSGYRPH